MLFAGKEAAVTLERAREIAAPVPAIKRFRHRQFSRLINLRMNVQTQKAMLPTMLRRCSAWSISSPCQQLVSLAAFHSHRLLELPARGLELTTQPTYGTFRREVRAFSRKRNIFLDPSERDETMNSLTVRIVFLNRPLLKL